MNDSPLKISINFKIPESHGGYPVKGHYCQMVQLIREQIVLTLFEVSTISDIMDCHQRRCGYFISDMRWFADSVVRSNQNCAKINLIFDIKAIIIKISSGCQKITIFLPFLLLDISRKEQNWKPNLIYSPYP